MRWVGLASSVVNSDQSSKVFQFYLKMSLLPVIAWNKKDMITPRQTATYWQGHCNNRPPPQLRNENAVVGTDR